MSEVMRIRGSNQSADTKFATTLVDDAITVIKSGRVHAGVELLQRAILLLPDVGGENQESEARKRRYAAAKMLGVKI